MEIMYRRDGSLHTCLLDYENITNICYGCGSQYHKFDSCVLNSKISPWELRTWRSSLKLWIIVVLARARSPQLRKQCGKLPKRRQAKRSMRKSQLTSVVANIALEKAQNLISPVNMTQKRRCSRLRGSLRVNWTLEKESGSGQGRPEGMSFFLASHRTPLLQMAQSPSPLTYTWLHQILFYLYATIVLSLELPGPLEKLHWFTCNS